MDKKYIKGLITGLGAGLVMCVLVAAFTAAIVLGNTENNGIVVDSGSGIQNEVTQKKVTQDEATQDDTKLTEAAQNEAAQDASSVLNDTDEGELLNSFFIQKMELMYSAIQEIYIDDVDAEEIRTALYKALFDSLGDPYSCYYTEKEYSDIMESSSGVYCGIGATLSQGTDKVITIVSPFKDGPAYNAGMMSGDIILGVDGKSVDGMDLSSVVAKVKGTEGTVVKITVKRGEEIIELYITRGMIEVPTVESKMFENNIGYISVSQFDEVTVKQFSNAYDELSEQGMTSLIIDLRDNPGGLLSSVHEMLGYLLPKDALVVYTEDKYGKRNSLYSESNHKLDVPLVLLTNGNSASASEIFAGAVKDYQLGTLMGTTTFGKGIVQSVLPLTDGTGIKLTVSRYFTPSGVCIHGTGIEPDVYVELSDDIRNAGAYSEELDNQLQAAIEYLSR